MTRLEIKIAILTAIALQIKTTAPEILNSEVCSCSNSLLETPENSSKPVFVFPT